MVRTEEKNKMKIKNGRTKETKRFTKTTNSSKTSIENQALDLFIICDL